MSGDNRSGEQRSGEQRTGVPRAAGDFRSTVEDITDGRLRPTTGLRLTLLFTGITIMAVALLFLLTYFSFLRTLRQDDVRDMQNRLLSYWAQFQTGGVELLENELTFEQLMNGERPVMVRVATATNRTVLFAYPEAWEAFARGQIEMLPLDPARLSVLESADYDYALEVTGIWLSDEYFLQLGISTRNRERLLGLFQRNFLLIAIAVIGAGFTVGMVAAVRALRPIERVTAVAGQIVATGRLDARVERGTGSAELTHLVDVINAMLERIARLVDGMRSTVDMVAHDLRTPITRMRARAELALRTDDPAESQNALAETVEQSDEILRLVNTLLEITEAESGLMRLSPERVIVSELVSDVTDLYEMVAEERRLAVTVNVPAGLAIRADRVRTRQVIANLVDNALKYCREGGEVTISADAAPDGMVGISVRDTGPGLDAGEHERVWDRMYRGAIQPEQPGLGLGLSLVKAVVEAHGGEVSAASGDGDAPNGARFTVTFPAA